MNEGIVDHSVDIEKVLPIALKYENQVFGSDTGSSSRIVLALIRII